MKNKQKKLTKKELIWEILFLLMQGGGLISIIFSTLYGALPLVGISILYVVLVTVAKELGIIKVLAR